jgi:hypothetical protein
MMNINNYNRRTSPFIHRDDKGVRQAVSELTAAKFKIENLSKGMLNDKGQLKDTTANNKQKYQALQNAIKSYEEQIAIRNQELATISIPTTAMNSIKNRSDLLASLKGNYIEDMDFNDFLKQYQSIDFPSMRPRMEPDVISESIDIVKSENERLMEKIFAVQLSPRDLMELDLEIIADPYWLGVPNILSQGRSGLETLIELPTESSNTIKEKLNQIMPGIDPEWNTKQPVWAKGMGVTQWYKGSPLIYFNTQVPDGNFKNDMLQFNANDQIVGIYLVKMVTNEFKNGMWTQKLKTVRDPTIPSYVLPRGLTGDLVFETWMDSVLESPDKAIDIINELKKEADDRQKLMAAGNMTAGTAPPVKVQAANPRLNEALERQRQLLAENPAPVVNDPVETAKKLMVPSAENPNPLNKQQAYQRARTIYQEELLANAQHMESINKKAFAEANVTDTRPYDAKTVTSLAMERSGAGGLEAWKTNSSMSSLSQIETPAKSNNPLGIGYDSETEKYYKYKDFNSGVTAANEYFNYGAGVKQVGVQGNDRLLLTKEINSADQLSYIKNKLKGGG